MGFKPIVQMLELISLTWDFFIIFNSVSKEFYYIDLERNWRRIQNAEMGVISPIYFDSQNFLDFNLILN